MCGAMTLSWRGPLTLERSGCSTLLMNIPGNALLLRLGGNSRHRMSSISLSTLFSFRGIPEHIRSDNGPEFTAKAVRKWLGQLGVKTLFIEPASPWENGYIGSFNGKLRDELLNREIFTTLAEAKILIEQWRREYNQIRPHSSLGYRPPAPEAKIPVTLT
jgi:putative transposase